MAIALACPHCGARMEYQDQDAGRAGQCPSCRGEIRVPANTKMCVGCRRLVAAEAVSCPACGAALGPGAAVSSLPPAMTPPVGPTAEPETSGKAVWSLVLGLLSFVLAILTGLPAIILGALALGDIRRRQGRLKGQGMAIAGIVTGGVGSVMLLCVGPILIALLLPAVQMAREAARKTQCRNNMHQIGSALANYHSLYNSFPPAATYDAAGRPLLSWRVLILPFIEENALYQQFHLDEPWDSPHNLPLANRMPQVFRCPSEGTLTPNVTSYVAITGEETVFPPHRTVRMQEITDGTPNTAMVGELRSSTIVWTKPEDVLFDANLGPGRFSSSHIRGANMLFADGSVRFIEENAVAKNFRAMMTIRGGELIQGSGF